MNSYYSWNKARPTLKSAKESGSNWLVGYICVNSPVESVPYGQSVIPANRLDYIEALAERTLAEVPGNVLEVGVYKAGSLLPLARALNENPTCERYGAYGIDTFTGHPYTDGHPVHPKGKYSDVDFGELERFLITTGLFDRIQLHKGRVEDIWPTLELPKFSFVHIDCDLYLPVKFCAQQVPRLMNKGGVLFFDDYGHEHCPGATRAIKEIFPNHPFTEVSMEDDGTRWSCFMNF
ncbi:MAG: class I SAM-dependent methyltransferase [Verrucomicrobiota bacterium]